jgi:sphingosine kinase
MNDNNKIKTLYVLNPTSGRSNAEQIFNEIKPYINNEYITLVTKEKNQAYDVLSSIYLDNIDQIIGIGGDGTIKEIIEAIKNNKNFNNISVGHIPAGTGNGLAASIMYSNGYKYNLMNSLIPIKNKTIGNIDVAEITTEKKKYHSFLAISLGFISDLDINTEVLRWMGSFRYNIGAIIGLFNMQTYHAKIEYKKNDSKEWEELEEEFLMIWACNLSHPSHDVFISDCIKFDDGYHHLAIIKNNITRWEMLWLLLNMNDGKMLEHNKVIYIKTKEYKINVLDKKAIITIDGEKIKENNLHVKVNNEDIKIIK